MTHLFRGAPIVRSWSKYQATDERWALCGIDRRSHGKAGVSAPSCVEEASLVDCLYCLELMRPSAKIAAKEAGGKVQ
jgi:hypothetical protein